MIRDKLPHLRESVKPDVVITPRTNGLETGLFQHDVEGVLNNETVKLIDGFCIPKVDRVADVVEIDLILADQEKKYSLEP